MQPQPQQTKVKKVSHVEEKNIIKIHDSSAIDSIPEMADPPQWYAVYTRSKFEKKLYNALQKAGFEAFLPLIEVRKVWSDRIKKVSVPLLTSYVFIKVSKSQFVDLYYFPGFVRLVAFEGKPCVINEREIELLETIIEGRFKAEQSTFCEVGDQVKIIRGPLKDWEGIVASKKGCSRIVFQFNCLQQAISVEVCMSNVERLN